MKLLATSKKNDEKIYIVRERKNLRKLVCFFALSFI
jgi:hypothetical protein